MNNREFQKRQNFRSDRTTESFRSHLLLTQTITYHPPNAIPLALHEQVAYAEALRFFHGRLERVEIVWNHRLERMLFVKPPLAETHTDLEKQGMIDKLDFMDATRMTTFIEVRARARAARRRAHTPSDFDVVQ